MINIIHKKTSSPTLSLLKSILNFLIYREPDNEEGFELLEGENEGISIDYKEANGTIEKKDKKGFKPKHPLNAKEWNAVRTAKTRTAEKKDTNMISSEINTNLEYIKHRFKMYKNQDVIIREFKVAGKLNAFLLFLDGMVNKLMIDDIILKHLMSVEKFSNMEDECVLKHITDNVLPVNQIRREKQFDNVIMQVLNGITSVFIDGYNECLLIETIEYEKRNVEKPSTETVIRGSQEGFTENLKTNLTLIRRIIRSEKLITEILPVGKANNLNCAILYLDGVANPSLVKSVPSSFFELLQSPEDYFLKWQFGTFLRLVRLLGLLMASILPGLYIALILFHQEMIPTDLLISIAQSSEAAPFPTVIELLLMETSFELIREAGLRVPGALGITLSIIGALILGQAAVAANIVTPVLIIIVAVAGIGSFAIPSYSLGFGIRIIRFVFIILGAIAGFFGISAGLFALVGMMCKMKSFGVPFFTPVAPKTRVKPDVIIEHPIYKQTERMEFVNPIDKKAAGKMPRGWVKKKGRK